MTELPSATTGYAANYSAGCTGNIAMGQSQTCTVNNYYAYNALVVTKIVNNKYGGTATSASFTMNVYSGETLIASIPGNAQGTIVPMPTGPYSVTETSLTAKRMYPDVGCSGTIALARQRSAR